ncbi:MAG: replicative DNA helicase [Candidatus Marinimicrobia bacterium]|nr:replicative DNA helicase [Candidatus Neomarinimicrobiota bacterium]
MVEDITRTPPQSIEAEIAVLGAMMLEPDAAYRGIELLKESDFYKEAHQLIFRSIKELSKLSQAIDHLTVTEKLIQLKLLDKIGGSATISKIIASVPTAANIEYYAQIVSDKATLRTIITTSTKLITDAYNEKEEVGNMLDNAEQNIFSLKERTFKGDFNPIPEIIQDTIDHVDKLSHHKGEVIGIHTGFAPLDSITSGFQQSDLIIIAGRPSMGKTALAITMARSMAISHHYKVGIFSLEMSEQQLGLRFLSSQSGIDHQKLRKGNVPGALWNDLTKAASALSEADIFIDDTAGLNILDIRSRARRLKNEKGLDILFIDYLQLAHATGRIDNRQHEISSISQGLKALSKELKIPVIALSQLSREVEKRGGDHKPQLSDLRESGAIEQDADVVMFVFRPIIYSKDPEDEGKAELIISKQRNGPIGKVDLNFQKNIARFYELTLGEYQDQIDSAF